MERRDTFSGLTKAIEKAYKHFNKELFMGLLPDCVITIEDGKGFKGYFHKKQWRQDGDLIDQITINPRYILERNVQSALSTLVHEMCHLEQERFGKKDPKDGYHDLEWVRMMERVGLTPVSLTPHKSINGKTGYRVTHNIDTDGKFMRSYEKLMKKGFSFPVNTTKPKTRKKSGTPNKKTYKCPICRTTVWGKQNLSILCGICNKTML